MSPTTQHAHAPQAEAEELFSAYDVDASGVLELPEVRMLLQDLCERRRGHRNVTEEQVLHAMEQMDEDRNGEVSVQEFISFLSGSTLNNVNVTMFGAS